MKAVLDTSVLAAAFLKRGGVNYQVVQAGRGGYEICLSEAILAELERVLLTYPRIRKRYPYTDGDVKEFVSRLREVSRVISRRQLQICSRRRDGSNTRETAGGNPDRVDLHRASKDPPLREKSNYEDL